MNSTTINRLIVLIIFYLNITTTQAQEIKLHINSGYANYGMSELKDFQKNLVDQIDIPLKITDNYPSYLTFEAGFIYEYKEYKVGIFYGRLSTGARATRSDYSGAYYMDNTLNSNLIGIRGELRLIEFKKITLWGGSSLGVLNSNARFKEKITITSISSKNVLKLKSNSSYLEFFTTANYQLKYINLYASIGYGFDLKGDLFLKDNNDAFLESNNRKVKTDWSGIRLRFGIEISLFKISSLI